MTITTINALAPNVLKSPKWQEKKQNEDFQKISPLKTIVCIAITVLILDYASLFGIYPILLLYALWFPYIIFYKKQFTLKLSKDIYIPVIIAAYAILSTAWSDHRDITLKGSLESASMVVISIIIARVTKLEAFLKGITFGVTLALIASLANGTHATDGFSGDYTLVGLFGSKNQLGFNAEIGALTALILLYNRDNIINKILFSMLPLTLCVVSLYLSHSASSESTLVGALMVCAGTSVLTKFPKNARKLSLIIGLFVVTFIVLIGLYFGLQKLGLNAFGKDSTLTGRTLLWSKGLSYGMDNPVLGIGYGNFWVPGRPLAEALWFKFGIFTRTGFHFHNTFIQFFVDLGIIGFSLFLSLFMMTCTKSLIFFLKYDVQLLTYYSLGMSLMFFARAFVEIDIGGTFGMGPLLFLAILPRLAMQQEITVKSA